MEQGDAGKYFIEYGTACNRSSVNNDKWWVTLHHNKHVGLGIHEDKEIAIWEAKHKLEEELAADGLTLPKL